MIELLVWRINELNGLNEVQEKRIKLPHFIHGEQRDRLTGNHFKIDSRRQEQSEELHADSLSPWLLS